MLEWIQDNQTLAWWLGIISAVSFVGTLILVPMAVIRIPPDYFASRHNRLMSEPDSGAIRALWHTGKNLLGTVLIAVGVLMLVLPGQGILTILIGVTLINFPGKYRLEKWIVSRRRVCRSINWLRRRAGRAPLLLDAGAVAE